MKNTFTFHLQVLISFIFVCQLNALTQIPEIYWEHSLGGSNDDRSRSICQTADGGYAVGGYSNSIDGDVTLNNGNIDYWLTKLNSLGEIEWEKSFGGSAFDYCYDVKVTPDNGYLLVGKSSSSDGDVPGNQGSYDYWALKTDNLGNIEWSKSYGGSGSDAALSCAISPDGGYIIGGSSSSADGDVTGYHGGSGDFWAVKINDIGEIEWEHAFGSASGSEGAYSIISTDDGYIAACNASANGGDVTGNHGFTDFWIVKLTDDGLLEWQKSFGGTNYDVANSIIQTSEGDYIVIGNTDSNNGDVSGNHGITDIWLIKFNDVGSIIWQRCYGGSDSDEGTSITEISNNEFVFSASGTSTDGDLNENKGDGDYWIVSIDSANNIAWQKTIGGTLNDSPFSITKADDNVVVAGYSMSSDFDVSFNHGPWSSPDFWVVKFGLCDNQYFIDLDGDGYGNGLLDTLTCDAPVGYVIDSTDCDDNNNLIHPAVEDLCNAIDDNCNGLFDEDATFITWYIDEDGDNFGNNNIDSLTCLELDGFVIDNTDCDDSNPNVYPGADETLNGIDDNCNNLIDEGLAIINGITSLINIFPNPTEDILFIDFANIESANFEVINEIGQNIYSGKKENKITPIDISKFPAGVYYINISTSSSNLLLKFVIHY